MGLWQLGIEKKNWDILLKINKNKMVLHFFLVGICFGFILKTSPEYAKLHFQHREIRTEMVFNRV